MSKIIGIDLGTTNSCVAVMDGGEAKIIQNSEGQRTTPSVVAYTDKNEKLVGQTAKNQIITNPENTIRSIKRFMGRKYDEVVNEINMVPYKVVNDGKGGVSVVTKSGKFSPQEISARILQKMKQTAEDYLGEPVTKAVITVPAYFNDEQRQATRDAGKIAGLEVERIINEPTAAALAYGLDRKEDNRRVAVFDLGGGTFDISILELGDGVFEVKSTNGDTHLGGDDFDLKLIEYFVSEFKKQTGIDVSGDNMALQRLKEAAENAKIELSSKMETDVNIPFLTADRSGPKHFQLKLSRAKFEQLIWDLLKKTEEPCRQALEDAGLNPGEIDEVVLVGGSTRIPAVQETVKNIFGKEPGKGVNPDEVVALGAAIQGGVLAGDVQDVLLLDVTPLSLGIETMGGVMTKLIERNTTIPARKSRIFTTAEDDQPAVSVHVLQGEREMAAGNRTLGRFELIGIEPAPRGIPQIEVTFDIDASGIVHVSAKDLATGKEQKIRIESSGGLSEEEIEKMVKDAEAHYDEDRRARELAGARNEADNLIYAAEKMINENSEKIDLSDRNRLERSAAELKEKVKGNSVDEINKTRSELQSLTQEITSKLYSEQSARNSGEGTNKRVYEESDPRYGADKVYDAEYEVVDDDDVRKAG